MELNIGSSSGNAASCAAFPVFFLLDKGAHCAADEACRAPQICSKPPPSQRQGQIGSWYAPSGALDTGGFSPCTPCRSAGHPATPSAKGVSPPSDQARSGRPDNRRIPRRSDRIRTKFIPKEKRCTHPLSAPAFPAALAPPYGGTRTTGNACASTQSVPRLSLGINSSLRIRSITS